METITLLSHISNTLRIESIRGEKKLYAWIKIIVPHGRKYLCSFVLNDAEITHEQAQKLINRKITKKIATQVDDLFPGSKTEFIHMTKLTFELDDGDTLHLRIGESYNIFYQDYLEHKGCDGEIKNITI